MMLLKLIDLIKEDMKFLKMGSFWCFKNSWNSLYVNISGPILTLIRLRINERIVSFVVSILPFYVLNYIYIFFFCYLYY